MNVMRYGTLALLRIGFFALAATLILASVPVFAAGHSSGHRGGQSGRHGVQSGRHSSRGYGSHYSYKSNPYYSHSYSHKNGQRGYYGHKSRAYSYSHSRRHYSYPKYSSSYYSYPSHYGGNASRPNVSSHISVYRSPSTSDHSTYGASGVVSGAGWSLLSSGHSSSALTAFAQEAESSPSKAAPKVGYSLASALQDDLAGGIWAMRRAFEFDPEGAHYVVIDKRLRSKVDQLIGRYRGLSYKNGEDPDPAFMLAALHYLLHDVDAARAAINQALAHGDKIRSTSNLKDLIDKELVRAEPAGPSALHPAPTPPGDQTIPRGDNY